MTFAFGIGRIGNPQFQDMVTFRKFCSQHFCPGKMQLGTPDGKQFLSAPFTVVDAELDSPGIWPGGNEQADRGSVKLEFER